MAKHSEDLSAAIALYEKVHKMAPTEPSITCGLVDAYLRAPGRAADGLALLDALRFVAEELLARP